MAWIDIYWPDKDKPRRRDIEDGLVLGRSHDCEETLDDESVSGKHAWIRPVKDKFLLVDLKSTNGVKVDGKRVTDFVLHNGQHFMLADIPCVFHNPAEPPPKEKKEEQPAKSAEQPVAKKVDLSKVESGKDALPEGGLPNHPALVYQCSECGYLMAEKGEYCTRCGDRMHAETEFIVEEPEAPSHPPAAVRVLSCLSLAAGMLGPLFLGIGWLLGIVFGMLVLVGYAEEAEETDMQRARYGILLSVLWITVAIWVGRYLYLRAGL